MVTLTHTHDKRARYSRTWGAVECVHEYGLDVEKREIYLFGAEEYGPHLDLSEPGVEYTMANKFIKNLRVLQSISEDPILIHMKTCGGDWAEGMAIFQAIEACPNYVTILNYSHARSMSSLIFLAADWRAMLPYSTYMFHEGTWGFEGTVRQARAEFVELQKANDQMLDIYVRYLRESKRFKDKTYKQIRAWLTGRMRDKEEVYLTAEEAVELNLADIIFGQDGTYDWKKLRMGWECV